MTTFRSVPGGLILLILLFLQTGWPAVARSAGSEFTVSGSDLQVDVNAKWVGCREGGYYPLRARIRNIGPARKITLECRPMSYDERVPIVTRDVTLEQNATVNTSLLIPMVDHGTYGNFRVLENGRPLKNLEQTISFPSMSDDYDHGLQLLIVSDRIENGQYFSSAVEEIRNRAGSSYYYAAATEQPETVNPATLPREWIAYSGLDLLAIPAATLLKRVDPEARAAILQWVNSGGWLLVYEVAEERSALDSLFAWDRRGFVGHNWDNASLRQFRTVEMPDPADNSRLIPETIDPKNAWNMSAELMRSRGYGMGQVILFEGNPFPGTISHWSWFLSGIQEYRLEWKKRNGIHARQGNASFLKFLIPGVGSVPVFSFLVLITIFTIVIGPLNYGYFLRKKKLAMLLVTVPLLAFSSSLLLLAYSTVANGFSVKSRVRSVTILDQGQNSSLSISRVAYYAGMSPSGGLVFQPTTAVFPIWPRSDSFEGGRVNWSDTQHWQTGWLKARTRTQFLTISQREQRGRIDFQGTGDKAEVSNGLEWPLDLLVVIDENGKQWVANNVKPGATAAMEPVTSSKQLSLLRDRIQNAAMEFPSGVSPDQNYGIFMDTSYRRRGGYDVDGSVDVYHQSQQEQLIASLGRMDEGRHRSSYYGLLGENPDLDLGLTRTSSRGELHLLVGYFAGSAASGTPASGN